MTCATDPLRSLIHFGWGAYVPARMAIEPCAFDGASVWLGARALSR